MLNSLQPELHLKCRRSKADFSRPFRVQFPFGLLFRSSFKLFVRYSFVRKNTDSKNTYTHEKKTYTHTGKKHIHTNEKNRRTQIHGNKLVDTANKWCNWTQLGFCCIQRECCTQCDTFLSHSRFTVIKCSHIHLFTLAIGHAIFIYAGLEKMCAFSFLNGSTDSQCYWIPNVVDQSSGTHIERTTFTIAISKHAKRIEKSGHHLGYREKIRYFYQSNCSDGCTLSRCRQQNFSNNIQKVLK